MTRTPDPTRAPWLALLRWLVVVRLLVHALYLPVFEGPDEPFHLARVAAFVDDGLVAGLRGDRVEPAVVAAIAAHPCAGDLAAQVGCPLFDGSGAEWNVLDRPSPAAEAPELYNYESHQPPLYYLAAAPFVALADVLPWPGAGSAEGRLLVLRLLSVALVAWAIAFPLRRLGGSRSRALEVAVLAVLLAPGAAESLARVTNDTPVFLWAALVATRLGKPSADLGTLALLAAGPLLKLTALPLAAVLVIALLVDKGWKPALAAGAAASAFVPLQLFRGWAWGGTLELGALGRALEEPVADVVVGVLHSVYTFTKTALWLGGWSVFRPPLALMVCAALLLVAWAASLRPAARPRHLWPHLAGLVLAGVGFVAFAIGKWGVFQVWGAVGGWYAWAWAPWLALLVADLFTVERRFAGPLAVASAAWLATANVLWFLKAGTRY